MGDDGMMRSLEIQPVGYLEERRSVQRSESPTERA